MKILFIEPKSPAEHVFSMVNIPRLGSVILGTIMRDRGHQSRVLIEEIEGDVTRSDLEWSDIVAISTITSTAPRAYLIGDEASRMGKTVVYGGPHVTFLPVEALNHGHFVVRGEGEETLPELVQVLESRRDPSLLAGLSFRRGDEVVNTPPRPLVDDLDSLPIPDFSLIKGWKKTGNVLPVATSRGCPFNCKFCSVVPMFGRRMRYHSVERIIEEIRRNGIGARHIFFCDDNFAANKDRAKDLMKAMIDQGLKIEWSTQVRVDAAKDEELLYLMKKANCYMVYIGFESINPKTLAAIRKNQSIAESKRAIKAFHRHGIHIHGMFIVGADDDLPGSVTETMHFARHMKIDSVQFLMLTPLPGTETFKELEDSGRLLTKDWNLYDGSYAVFNPRLMTAYDLQAETYRAYRRFYSWTSVLRKAISLDLFYTYLRLYGRMIIIRTRRRVKNYRKKLLLEIREKSRRSFGILAGNLQRPKIVFLADTIEDPYRMFFESFLDRLGLKVQTVFIRKQLQETGQNLLAGIELTRRTLRRRSEVLIVPLIEGVSSFGQQGQAGVKYIRQQLEGFLPGGFQHLAFGIDLKKHSLYQTAVDLGLALSKKPRRIRRAYRLALEEAGLQPASSC